MKNESKITRAFYIIIVPIVLLIILLNSGMFQRWFTAATVFDEDYSAVRYNYYYFSVYQDFLEQEYTGTNFNPNAAAGSQQYDENTTWKEHFCRLAEERMTRAAYYDRLAEEKGYEFSAEELAPVEEKLAAIAALCAESGVRESNYFPAYYGAGMDRARFEAELTREVRAAACRARLAESWEVPEADMDRWLAENPVQDYPLADVWVIELDAVPGRADGQVGQRQLDDLKARLTRLEERLLGGASVAELAERYADRAWGDGGLVRSADREDLPETAAEWCFGPGRTAGDSAALMDRENGQAYLVLMDSVGGSAARRAAHDALAAQAMDEAERQALAEQPVVYHTFGMQLTTN